MKLTPVLTEKSLSEVKKGKYTFWVSPNLNKNQIRTQISKVFSVEVVDIKTINYRKRIKTDNRRRKVTIGARKKAIVKLAEKQKIDLFEEKK